jgi:hypothetical protein
VLTLAACASEAGTAVPSAVTPDGRTCVVVIRPALPEEIAAAG